MLVCNYKLKKPSSLYVCIYVFGTSASAIEANAKRSDFLAFADDSCDSILSHVFKTSALNQKK